MCTQNVLIACRDRAPLKNIERAIALNHDVVVRQNGAEALETILLDMPGIVLMDVDIPGMNASEIVKRVQRSVSHSLPAFVMYGRRGDMRLRVAVTHGLAQGFIEVPSSDGAFLERLWKIVDSRLQASWSGLNEVQTALMESGGACVDMMARAATSETPVEAGLVNEYCDSVVAAARSNDLLALLGTLRAHNDISFSHCLKVSSMMTVFGLAIGIRDQDLARLAQAGLLHDIGKIVISPEVLLKPYDLSEKERKQVELHPATSAEILKRCDALSEEVIQVAANHHERLDGSGYPRGLKGARIDDLSLVCAVADEFAVLTEGTARERRLGSEDALAIMEEGTNRGLEPQFVKKFAAMVRDGLIP